MIATLTLAAVLATASTRVDVDIAQAAVVEMVLPETERRSRRES